MQPKLAVAKADDPFEREANLVAEQVMQVPRPDRAIALAPSQLDREHAARDNGATTAQGGSLPVAAGEAPGIVHEVLRSPGQPLDPGTRAFFEPRLEHDLGSVRIHFDHDAAESARAVGALAYAVGNHVVFSPGRYDTTTQDGRRLLAHELDHVVQHSDRGVVLRQAKPGGATLRPFVPAPAPGMSPPPPVPGTPEAIRIEAIGFGEQWGSLLGERDVALETLQTKWSGVSVWDTMTPAQKAKWASDAESQFARLPPMAQHDEAKLAAAQDDGFQAGVERGYSAAKLSAFFVRLGSELSIALFSGLAARGVRLPRYVARLMQRSVPRLVAPGTGAALGQKMAEEMLESGLKGNPFRFDLGLVQSVFQKEPTAI